MMVICGGVVVGFAPLKKMLLKENVFPDLCENNARVCKDKILTINRFYQISQPVMFAFGFFAGWILNKIGKKPLYTLCFILTIASFILFGYGSRPSVSLGLSKFLLTSSFSVFALTGWYFFVVTFDYANLLEQMKSDKHVLFRSIVVASWDLSSVVFTLFFFIIDHFKSITIWKLFFGYAIFLIIPFSVLIIFCDFKVPNEPETEKLLNIERQSVSKSLSESEEKQQQQQQQQQQKSTWSGVEESEATNNSQDDDNFENSVKSDFDEKQGLLKKKKEQEENNHSNGLLVCLKLIFTDYRVFVLFLGVIFFCLEQNFFISTLNEQAVWIVGSNKAQTEKLIIYFSFVLPCAGFPVSLILSYILRPEMSNGKQKGKSYRAYIIITLLNILFTIFSVIKNYYLQYPAYLFFVVWRVAYWIAIPNNLQELYPVNWITIYAMVSSLSGLSGSLLPSINSLVYSVWKGNFFYINLIWGCLSSLFTFLMIFIANSPRRIKNR
ncbi:protein fmp42 [Anaeramoeba flamelloides]|nr:protein fmp42 [Anaeramoeba flamelloides]